MDEVNTSNPEAILSLIISTSIAPAIYSYLYLYASISNLSEIVLLTS